MILTMTHGDEPVLRGTIRSRITRAPVDLTGCTVWFTVKRKFSEPSPGFINKSTKPTIGGIVIPNPVDGKFYVSFTNIDTAQTMSENMSQNNYLYEVQIKTLSGPIQTIAKGKFIIEGELTTYTS